MDTTSLRFERQILAAEITARLKDIAEGYSIRAAAIFQYADALPVDGVEDAPDWLDDALGIEQAMIGTLVEMVHEKVDRVARINGQLRRDDKVSPIGDARASHSTDMAAPRAMAKRPVPTCPVCNHPENEPPVGNCAEHHTVSWPEPPINNA